MSHIKTIRVSHLGGITAAYQTPASQPSIDPSKPTVILVNSFCTDSEQYRPQFVDQQLTDATNLVAIELLGHGQTRAESEHWTFWDTAEMNLQVMHELGIGKAFVLRTSQGGWITTRMALIAPKRILGIIPLGTSMDSESERTRKLGCWDVGLIMSPSIQMLTSSEPTPDYAAVDEQVDPVVDIGLGKNVSVEERQFWRKRIKDNYLGDEGRRRSRMASINLRDRDSLLGRLADVRCPVLWMHGTSDAVYSVANAKEEIEMFKNSPDRRLVVVEGGQHFLSASHPTEVNGDVLRFVEKNKDGTLP